MSDANANLNKKYPECAVEALQLIRSNYNRVSKQEFTRLAYEFVFFFEFKPETKTWIKVRPGGKAKRKP